MDSSYVTTFVGQTACYGYEVPTRTWRATSVLASFARMVRLTDTLGATQQAVPYAGCSISFNVNCLKQRLLEHNGPKQD